MQKIRSDALKAVKMKKDKLYYTVFCPFSRKKDFKLSEYPGFGQLDKAAFF